MPDPSLLPEIVRSPLKTPNRTAWALAWRESKVALWDDTGWAGACVLTGIFAFTLIVAKLWWEHRVTVTKLELKEFVVSWIAALVLFFLSSFLAKRVTANGRLYVEAQRQRMIAEDSLAKIQRSGPEIRLELRSHFVGPQVHPDESAPACYIDATVTNLGVSTTLRNWRVTVTAGDITTRCQVVDNTGITHPPEDPNARGVRLYGPVMHDMDMDALAQPPGLLGMTHRDGWIRFLPHKVPREELDAPGTIWTVSVEDVRGNVYSGLVAF